MSAFNSERYLRFRQVLTGTVLQESKPCRKCGYYLRGLAANKNCPECGTPIAVSLMRKLKDDTLGNAPIDYLRRIRLGVGLLLASPLLLALLVTVGPYLRRLLNANSADGFMLSALLGPALLWALGCLLLSVQRPTTHMPEGDAFIWRNRRLMLRLTSLGWALAPICFVILEANPNLPPTGRRWLAIIALLSLGVGVLNTTTLSHYFALLTAWAYDLHLARMFERLLWGIAAGLTLAMSYLLVAGNATLSLRSLSLFFFTALVALFWALAMLYLLWRLADMNTLTGWALRNAKTRIAYHERQRLGKTGVTSAQAPRDAS
ncbi:MAG: hypothetical protein ACF8NJ_00900 [Phycisphaerales bacterium JB038]